MTTRRRLCTSCTAGNHQYHSQLPMTSWRHSDYCPCTGECETPQPLKSFYPPGQFPRNQST